MGARGASQSKKHPGRLEESGVTRSGVQWGRFRGRLSKLNPRPEPHARDSSRRPAMSPDARHRAPGSPRVPGSMSRVRRDRKSTPAEWKNPPSRAVERGSTVLDESVEKP